MNKDDSGNWHLDKRVPISLIIAILVQTSGFLWFIAKMDSRIEKLESAVVIQRDIDKQQDSNGREALSSLRGDIREVDRKLDRLIERAQK